MKNKINLETLERHEMNNKIENSLAVENALLKTRLIKIIREDNSLSITLRDSQEECKRHKKRIDELIGETDYMNDLYNTRKLDGLKKYIKETGDELGEIEERNEKLEQDNFDLRKDLNYIKSKYDELNTKPPFEPILSDTIAVNYFGKILIVDREVKYLATDRDGELYGYISKPSILENNGYWDDPTAQTVSDILFNGDWRESLMEITDEDIINV